MSTEQRPSIPGIVRNGVVVPQIDHRLPEGSHVEILLHPSPIPSQVAEEIAAWDLASDEAWEWIDELESEKQ